MTLALVRGQVVVGLIPALLFTCTLGLRTCSATLLGTCALAFDAALSIRCGPSSIEPLQNASAQGVEESEATSASVTLYIGQSDRTFN